MRYIPVAHFNGLGGRTVDLTSKLPWLYIIAAPRARVIYIGETNDEGGLVVRLGAQFGPYPGSSLRKSTAAITGKTTLKAPFVVIAARLPFASDDAPFNGDSKQSRLVCEGVLHQLVAQHFLARMPGWTIVSSFGHNVTLETPEMRTACEQIYNCYEHTF